ncbi:MAG: PorT family protein [Chitinophagaceae bacterium]|nr:PorT family protein [Chitinophagaceae bacterium]
MKKTFLFVLFAAGVLVSHAQLNFGVKAGLNMADITGKDVYDYRSKAGIYVGGFASLDLTEKLSAKAEMFYSVQGARWDDDNEKTMLNYVQIPVLLKYNIASGFYAEAGPQVGFLLKAKDNNEGDVYSIKEFVKKNDVSLVIGAGYAINERIGVNTRYNAGLVKFYDEEKNSVFQLGVTYTFARRK